MKKNDVHDLLKEQLLPAFASESKKLNRIDRWLRWDPDRPRWNSTSISRENKYLMDLARTPWLAHVVTVVAQMLYLERAYSAKRTPDELDTLWMPFKANGLDERQIALHRAALAYGISYTLTLPGDRGAVIRGVSPRESLAVYADPVEDEFPMYWLRVLPQPNGDIHYRIYDDEKVYFLAYSKKEGKTEFLTEEVHGVGICPVVRYANQLDLEGRAPGEVEPLIPVAARINKTDYDRLLAQHYNSWKIRTATKLDPNLSDDAVAEMKLKIAQDTVLTGEGDVEFGTLDETNLAHFIAAHDSDIETLAAVSQTPATAYGKLINVSADGLVEARASLRAKVIERQKSFGAAHMRTLRLAAHVENRPADAADFTLDGYWADIESQTLNQAVDALGKAATMLGVPAQLLWDRIPGVDFTTAESWKAFARENPSASEQMAAAYARQLADNDGELP